MSAIWSKTISSKFGIEMYCTRDQGRGILRNAESCQGVVCGKFNADFFCGMKGKMWNESMRNVAELNIY